VRSLPALILIVDGYNIIGAWDDLKALKEADFGSARDQLISTLSAYYPWCWERIIIVFDGQRFNWEHLDGVEVVGYRVEVATSDFAEHRAAAALGASVLSAQDLKERLEEQKLIYRNRLNKSTQKSGIMINDLLQQSVIDNLERLRRP